MKDTTIAVDLAKNVFEIAISGEAGKVSKRLRVSRPKLVSFFAKQSAATVLLEACGSAHFWARTFRRLGHDVVLLPPHLVRPYRRGSKNDRADTKALLEAYRNEELLPVPIKSVHQHTLAALHRLRSGWLSTRTARINAVRGLLRELGFIIPKGAHFVVPALFELVEDADSDLPDVLRSHLRDACSEIREFKDKCAGIEHELKALTKQLPEVQRLLAIPGHRTSDRDRHRGLRRRSSPLPIGAPLLELPRPSSQGKLQWRHSPPRTHHQAWRLLPPYAPHPGRARRAPRGERQQEPARQAPRLGSEGPPLAGTQQGRDCCRQQTRPDRLGRLHPRE